MKIKLIFLLIFLLMFSSCFSENEAKKAIKSKEKSYELLDAKEEEEVAADKENIEETFPEDSSDIILEIKEAIDEGDYEEVISLTEDEEDLVSRYYRGIAYMSMMMKRESYSEEERLSFRDQAEELLLEIGYQSNDEELQAKALLWYGFTLDVAYSDLENKKKAINAFWKIERTKLRDTASYNDALFYAAQTYARMGWYGVSRSYFNRVASAFEADDEVYDYVNNDFYSVEDASELGLERLEEYMDGTHSVYENKDAW